MNRKGQAEGADAMYFIVFVFISILVTFVIFKYPEMILSAAVQPVDADMVIMQDRLRNQLGAMDPFVGWRSDVQDDRPLAQSLGTLLPGPKRFGINVMRETESWYPSVRQKELYDAAVVIKPDGIRVQQDTVVVGGKQVSIGMVYPERYERFE